MGQNIIIKQGDTLAALAAKYGTTVEELAKLNDIKNVNSIFAGKTLQVQSEGLSIEKSKPKTESSSQSENTPDNTKEKTTQYAVQIGDSIEGVVKKSLKAQGIENPDKKQLKDATEKFIKDNGGVDGSLVKTNKKGVKFLKAGSTVKLDGEVDVKDNKSADEVKNEWAYKYGKPEYEKKSSNGTIIKGFGATKGKYAAKEVWSNGTTVTRSGNDGHGHFTQKIETRKDGTVVVSTEPNPKNGSFEKRVLNKNGTQITYTDLNEAKNGYKNMVTNTGERRGDVFENEVRSDGTTFKRSDETKHRHYIPTVKFEKDGIIMDSREATDKDAYFDKEIETHKDGSEITRSGNDGHGNYTKEVEIQKDGTITTRTEPDGKGGWKKIDIQKK